MQPLAAFPQFVQVVDALAAWWCSLSTGWFAPVLAALGLACPTVPLDPHYAPLFVVGNSWTYQVHDSFLRDMDRPDFDGLVICTVTRVESRTVEGVPSLLGVVQCKAKRGKETYLDTTWVADANGLRKSGWWDTQGHAFDQERPWLLAHPPKQRDHVFDTDTHQVVSLATFHKRAGNDAEYVFRESVDQHPVAVDRLGRRSAWTIAWDNPMGAGFYCILELAEGIGPIQFNRKIGSDEDDEYRTVHLVAFKPAPRLE